MLFPSVKQKGLSLGIYYNDSFVGRVTIDGNADLHTALITFSEESDLDFRTLHVYDVCPEPSWKSAQNDETDCPAKKGERLVW